MDICIGYVLLRSFQNCTVMRLRLRGLDLFVPSFVFVFVFLVSELSSSYASPMQHSYIIDNSHLCLKKNGERLCTVPWLFSCYVLMSLLGAKTFLLLEGRGT